MIEQYIKTNSFAMLHVCIDEESEFTIKGRAYCCTQTEPILFDDISKLILQADTIFDRNGNPMAFEEKRSFQQNETASSYHNRPYEYKNYKSLCKYTGDVRTFDIVILSRRKSSWQGILFQDDKEEPFVDVLELIKKL